MFRFFGEIMSSGRTHSSNSWLVTMPRAIAASFSVVPSLWAFLAAAAALSYPVLSLRAVTSMRDSFKSWAIRFSFACIFVAHKSGGCQCVLTYRQPDCTAVKNTVSPVIIELRLYQSQKNYSQQGVPTPFSQLAHLVGNNQLRWYVLSKKVGDCSANSIAPRNLVRALRAPSVTHWSPKVIQNYRS